MTAWQDSLRQVQGRIGPGAGRFLRWWRQSLLAKESRDVRRYLCSRRWWCGRVVRLLLRLRLHLRWLLLLLLLLMLVLLLRRRWCCRCCSCSFGQRGQDVIDICLRRLLRGSLRSGRLWLPTRICSRWHG